LAALVALLSLFLLQAAPHLSLHNDTGAARRRSPLALASGGLLWALLTVGLPFSLTDTPAPLTLLGPSPSTPQTTTHGRTLRRVACLAAAAALGQMAAASFRDAQVLEDGLVTGGERRATARAAKALALGSSLALMGTGMGPLVAAAAAAHAAVLAWLLGTGADGSLARGLAEVQGAGVLAAVVAGEAGLLFPQAKTEGDFAKAVTELLRVGGRGGGSSKEEEAAVEAAEAAASVVVPEPEAAAPRAPDAPPPRPSKQRPQEPLALPFE
jgi:hypothetical protein